MALDPEIRRKMDCAVERTVDQFVASLKAFNLSPEDEIVVILAYHGAFHVANQYCMALSLGEPEAVDLLVVVADGILTAAKALREVLRDGIAKGN